MRRIDVVGLSLAELSLALLFAFLAITLPNLERLKHLEKVSRDRADDAERKLSDRKAPTLAAKAGMSVAKGAQDAKLRSAARPSCIEMKVADGALLSVTINGVDEYAVEGLGSVSLIELTKQYSGALDEGLRLGCVHVAEVYLAPGISAVDYDSALRKIESYFYTRKRGSR
jgi:hypothetical protein